MCKTAEKNGGLPAHCKPHLPSKDYRYGSFFTDSICARHAPQKLSDTIPFAYMPYSLDNT